MTKKRNLFYNLCYRKNNFFSFNKIFLLALEDFVLKLKSLTINKH